LGFLGLVFKTTQSESDRKKGFRNTMLNLCYEADVKLKKLYFWCLFLVNFVYVFFIWTWIVVIGTVQILVPHDSLSRQYQNHLRWYLCFISEVLWMSMIFQFKNMIESNTAVKYFLSIPIPAKSFFFILFFVHILHIVPSLHIW